MKHLGGGEMIVARKKEEEDLLSFFLPESLAAGFTLSKYDVEEMIQTLMTMVRDDGVDV